MSAASLNDRVTALEAEVARLKARLEPVGGEEDWLDKIWGSFKNDPIYEDAMRLGKEYRDFQIT